MFGILFFLLTVTSQSFGQQQTGEFKDWDNLKTDIPQWFKDAKFGIYFHWGVYSVPAYVSEWYSRSMYVPNTTANKHHLATYGSLNEFGYKDFIPMFKAEYFNADEWVDLFVRAGAKFAGLVAEHADGFSMWDSKVNPWNAKNMGPQRDIMREMENAIRKRNLKFITTFHHQWQWGWYPTFNTRVDAGDPKYATLYGPVVSDSAWLHKSNAEKPDSKFSETWLAKVKEVINTYNPDILYFDSRLGHIPDKYRKEVVTTYLHKKEDKKEKLILYKSKDLPSHVGMRIYEKSRLNKLGEMAWLTEEPITTYSWSYTHDMKLRSSADILNGLIDIVSKNGIYLLNICPKSDGTIPVDQQEILLAIGRWLDQFGESIYATRPWYTYGEGPRREADKKDQTSDRSKFFELTFTADDIRYTTKGDVVYAIVLGKLQQGQNRILKSFNKDVVPQQLQIIKVTIPGSNEKVEWQYVNEGLSIKIPRITGNMAAVFKIETALK